MELHNIIPFTVDSQEKVVLTFPLVSFFADLLKKALEEGKVEEVP